MSISRTYPTAEQVDAFEALSPTERIARLSPFLEDSRINALRAVLARRTRRLTVGVENIFHSQNASAVVRTCECFGLQDLTIVENSNRFDAVEAFPMSNGVARGGAKWTTFHRFNATEFNTPEAYSFLRERGYRILAASPHPGHDISLYDVDVVSSGPIAVFFGAEKLGLSSWAMENADAQMVIPMHGLTESLNISASAAVVVSHLRHQMDALLPTEQMQLPQDEQDDIFSHWLLASVRDASSILDRILK